MSLFKKYHWVRQHDIKDCGAACISTVSKHYGLHIPISKIREYAGTDRNGTNVYGLIQAAEKLGFSAKGVRGNVESLKEIPLPAIAHVIINGKLLHYVVILEITKKGKVIVADPGEGIIKYDIKEFNEIWTGVLVLLIPNESFQSRDEEKNTFSRFMFLLKNQQSLLIPVFLSSILITIFGVLGAFYFKIVIDNIVTENLKHTLTYLSIGIIVLYIFKVLLELFRSHLILYLSRRLDIKLMFSYYKHVLSLPMNFFETRKVGEIISRFQDAAKIREALATTTLTVMIDTIMVIAGSILLYTQSSTLFFITALHVPIYILIIWMFQRSYEKINRQEMESNAELTSYIVESLNGISTIKSYNAEKEAEFQTEKRLINLLQKFFKRFVITNSQESLKTIVELVGGVVILWVGAISILDGEMTIGQLVAYNALLVYFLDPIKNLVDLQPTLQSAFVASKRLTEILDLDLEKNDQEDKKLSPTSFHHKIRLDNITFKYGTRQNIFNNLSFEIPIGYSVGFVGESGSGKTTIAKLLMRYYDVNEGNIYYDNYHIKDMNRTGLRNKIAYVAQESFFFSGSIFDNLVFGLNKEVTMDKIIDACILADAHEFISSLPLRYDTLLEENASNVSGGQRQRLSIARALLKEADVLILDEATSHLDSASERKIIESLKEYRAGQLTTITIAHRLSTIMHCDNIFVMSKGEIIEEGKHGELINKVGLYRELWNNQLPQELLEITR
ncbi:MULTISPECIES: peptidase domain-containing ABC transporter [Bacillus cereus group]|uniref:Lactococcin-G-processing and transport ATP-binding protein LagD n=1 Tax=Bacillus cereus 03BB108 TaxID=451709 RepID=A0AAN0T1U5_BACCE|nr:MULTISPECIES: peptidase domain-containing ABC transporter [Bacillus cereus group]ABK87259.1 bacteriocin-processing peptidase, Cysteine peptidase, MEROPS family C39 [Bacillus thuringiensis str. Al Hakam]AJH70844.1 lactococcin-G-processing and transport ATP-binding protein LagD [Bacillus thuringiensis]AJI14371.1 lactococcin-G-processing and transport ATP-binding protein LagD [Bacillus cereus 03BB108]EDX63114.1 lactococcin-G-processing and transport ATP-binding protein LagD [Bacillus cereus 03B